MVKMGRKTKTVHKISLKVWNTHNSTFSYLLIIHLLLYLTNLIFFFIL